jgi:hypothetical protein
MITEGIFMASPGFLGRPQRERTAGGLPMKESEPRQSDKTEEFLLQHDGRHYLHTLNQRVEAIEKIERRTRVPGAELLVQKVFVFLRRWVTAAAILF